VGGTVRDEDEGTGEGLSVGNQDAKLALDRAAGDIPREFQRKSRLGRVQDGESLSQSS